MKMITIRIWLVVGCAWSRCLEKMKFLVWLVSRIPSTNIHKICTSQMHGYVLPLYFFALLTSLYNYTCLMKRKASNSATDPDPRLNKNLPVHQPFHSFLERGYAETWWNMGPRQLHHTSEGLHWHPKRSRLPACFAPDRTPTKLDRKPTRLVCDMITGKGTTWKRSSGIAAGMVQVWHWNSMEFESLWTALLSDCCWYSIGSFPSE